MTVFKIALVCMAGAVLSACASNVQNTAEPIAKQMPVIQADTSAELGFSSDDATTPDIFKSPVSVQRITVAVPETLRVSEANRYYPSADIIWREDPIGNRYKQVQTIMQDAMAKGTDGLDGELPVRLHIEVRRFHALTEKARYTIGGVHAVRFVYVLEDARTGVRLTEPRTVQADLEAFGGAQAIAAEARGVTQKSRITDHLAEVIRQELTRPKGYKNPQLGLFQAINQI